MCTGYFCTNCGQCGKTVVQEMLPVGRICLNCATDLTGCMDSKCPICGAPVFVPAGSKSMSCSPLDGKFFELER